MASSILSYLLFASVLCFSCLNNVLCLEKNFGFEGKASSGSGHHFLRLSSLLPNTICSPSTKVVGNRRAVMKVVEKHGPCSKFQSDKTTKAPTPAEILRKDAERVNSIQSRLSKKTDATTIQAKSGITIGSPNYIVTVGLGTPKMDLSLIFDTGSDLTWTQCQPCNATYCYPQRQPLFDPSKSTSYSNISCTSQDCSLLTSATGNKPGCSKTSRCIYDIEYGDKSYSVGLLGKERITVSSSDALDDFIFGCGLENQGLFNGSAGLLGLGRNPISFVGQTAPKYNRVFSYCLPRTSSSTGFLTFGKDEKLSGDVKYVPLTTVSQGDSFYGLKLEGISIEGRQVPIPASVFSSSGAIIDSGTVITRLPATAYSSFRTEFRKEMTDYKMTPPADSLLDTCYDFSGNENVNVPKISLLFGGGSGIATSVDLDPSGVFFAVSESQICLAFAGNMDDADITILGNVQQKSLEVVYDIPGGRIGFRSAAC